MECVYGMFGVTDGVLVVVFVTLLYIMNHFKGIITQLEERLNDSITNIEKNEFEMPSLNALKDEVLDIVESTIENLQPPTALDHIAGAVSQYFQFKLMRDMKLEGVAPQIPEIIETAKDVIDNIKN